MKKTVLSLALICLGLAMTAAGKRVRHPKAGQNRKVPSDR